jgi:hypothetical protein
MAQERNRLGPMPLVWEATAKLIRLQGMAEELLASARGASDSRVEEAVDAQLGAIVHETHTVLALCDDSLAAEFERMVRRIAPGSVPAELRVAALVGWLRAELNVDSLEQQRAAVQTQREAQEPVRRKHTIGFRIRSPLTREPKPEETTEQLTQ